MQIDKPRCDLTSCRNYFDGNCTRDYEICGYPKCKAVNDKIKYEGYALCKLDEVVENIRISENNVVREWIKPEKAIEIIKEACRWSTKLAIRLGLEGIWKLGKLMEEFIL